MSPTMGNGPPSTAPTPRPATGADVARLVEVLARAFDDDPVACFMFRGEHRRRRGLRRFFGVQLRHMYLDDGEVWTTPDTAGVAVWAPPTKARPGWRDLWHLSPLVPQLLAMGRSLPDAARLLAEVDRSRPKEAHWYLATLGTDPDRQGHGVGSALLRTVLRRVDEQGMGAYLESSKQRNVSFYARHGFAVTGEIQVPHGGPHMWLMWREPQAPTQ
ncbi:MAG: GNAT family N-acetyltransferase [Acidimicrobiales bacterium]